MDPYKPVFEAQPTPVPEEAIVIVDWAEREQTARAYDRLAAPELRAESLHAVADLLDHLPDSDDIRKLATGVKLRELWALAACENATSTQTIEALGRLRELAPKRSGLLALIAGISDGPKA